MAAAVALCSAAMGCRASAAKEHGVRAPEGARPLPAPTASAVTGSEPAEPSTEADHGVPQTGRVGGPFPTTVEAAASDRSWLVYCQATRDTDGDGSIAVSVGPRGDLSGDALQMYLALADRAPEPIEALWGVDPSERWLVVEKQEQAVVVDTAMQKQQVISQSELDLRESPEVRPWHRALAFQRHEGVGLLYSRVTGPDEFEIRSLPLGTPALEGSVAFKGRLLRLRTSFDGAWWVVESVEEDTNHNGRLDLPLPSAEHKQRCHGAFWPMGAWQPQGDRVTTRVRSADSGAVYRVEDFASPLGDGFLFRDSAARLYLRKGGKRKLLAPADCGAQVVYADAERGLALIACRGPQPTPAELQRSRRRRSHQPPAPPRSRLPLWLVGENLNLDLHLELGPTGADSWPEGSRRLVPIHAGAERRLLDMRTLQLIALNATDSVLWTFDTRALLIRPGEAEIMDAALGTSLLRITGLEDFPEVLHTGRFVKLGARLVDLGAGKIVGDVEEPGRALSSDGRVLRTLGARREGMLPLGPLYWQSPTSH